MLISDNYAKINYGIVIYTHRKKKKLSQEALAEGICSKTYLSKLENNKLDNVNTDIVQPLLQRLDLDVIEYEETLNTVKHDLELLYEAINRKNKNAAIELYKDIKKYNSDLLNPDIQVWYNLILARYEIMNNDLINAKTKLNNLLLVQKKLDQRQSLYYLYFKGILAAVQNQYRKGTEFLEEALKVGKELNYIDGNLIYHLSLIHFHSQEFNLSLYYGNQAYEYYLKQSNIPRIIDSHMLIALNYIPMQLYDQAESILIFLLHSADLINHKLTIAKCYHNLGCIYSCRSEYKKAIEYLEKSLTLKYEESETYSITVLALIEAYYGFKKHDKALKLGSSPKPGVDSLMTGFKPESQEKVGIIPVAIRPAFDQLDFVVCSFNDSVG